MRTANLRLGLWLVFGGLLLPIAAQAQDARVAESADPARKVNGHTFLRSQVSVWPFITTYFGTSTGVGWASYQRNGKDAQGNPVDSSMSLGAFAESFDVGVAITEWLGLQSEFTGLVLTGADLNSALNVGAIFGGEWRGRALVRLWQTSISVLSAGLQSSYTFGKNLQPLNLLSGGGLLTDIKSWGIGPAVSFAIAPVAWLGVQTSVVYEHGKLTVGDASDSQNQLAVTGGVSLDFNSLGVPLALPVVYAADIALGDSSSEAEHRVESGLVYSGRSNLDLGLTLTTKLGQQDDKEYVGAFRMYYFW